jgi:hypothetical protein
MTACVWCLIEAPWLANGGHGASLRGTHSCAASSGVAAEKCERPIRSSAAPAGRTHSGGRQPQPFPVVVSDRGLWPGPGGAPPQAPSAAHISSRPAQEFRKRAPPRGFLKSRVTPPASVTSSKPAAKSQMQGPAPSAGPPIPGAQGPVIESWWSQCTSECQRLWHPPQLNHPSEAIAPQE